MDVSGQDDDDVTFLNVMSGKIYSNISFSFFDIDYFHKLVPVQRHRIEVQRYRTQIRIIWKHRICVSLILQQVFIFQTVHVI